jgi:nucleotide-binding universal stress UspA family protein
MANIVIVGVDGSESSRAAARRAAEFAAATGASLHVVAAVNRGAIEEFPDRPGASQVTSGEMAESVVSDVARELSDVVSMISTNSMQGKPAVALVEEAERLGARLIVVGNRRTQGVGRILGSVASGVVAHSPCDVYIVKTV